MHIWAKAPTHGTKAATKKIATTTLSAMKKRYRIYSDLYQPINEEFPLI